jgi:hypothetical protein
VPNRLRHFLVLLVAAIVLAGCSQNLGPKNYNDEVKANYTNTCVDGATERLGEAAAKTYCECTYSAISAPAPAGISFDTFKSFETYLRENVGSNINNIGDLEKTGKYDAILKLFAGCVVAGPTTAGASATTTIPPTTTAR